MREKRATVWLHEAAVRIDGARSEITDERLRNGMKDDGLVDLCARLGRAMGIVNEVKYEIERREQGEANAR